MIINEIICFPRTFKVESQFQSVATTEALEVPDFKDFIAQQVNFDKQCLNKIMNPLRTRVDVCQNKLMHKGIAFSEMMSCIYENF